MDYYKKKKKRLGGAHGHVECNRILNMSEDRLLKRKKIHSLDVQGKDGRIRPIGCNLTEKQIIIIIIIIIIR
jgi:hypothetical protein